MNFLPQRVLFVFLANLKSLKVQKVGLGSNDASKIVIGVLSQPTPDRLIVKVEILQPLIEAIAEVIESNKLVSLEIVNSVLGKIR